MTAGVTLTCMYTCHGCGVNEAEVPVLERDLDQDVRHWVLQTLGAAVTADHQRRSPGCRCDTFDLKIPLAKKEGFRVGEAIRQ